MSDGEIAEVAQPTSTPLENSSPSATAPRFIRDFSKEYSHEERNAKALEIRQKRNDYFNRKDGLKVKADEIAQVKTDLITEIETKTVEVARIQDTIDALPDSWPQRTLKYFELRRLSKAKDQSVEGQEQTLREVVELEKQEQVVRESLAKNGSGAELGEARELLKKFYEQEKKKWENTPYDKNELRSLFSQAHLAALSLEEYTLLLKRFPSDMVTHVTRQGVRDHASGEIMGHSAGIYEYHNEFKKIIESGKIKSATGVYFKDGMTKEAMAEMLSIRSYDSREQAKKGIKNYASIWARDKSALHFAVNDVLDGYYGGEEENEIFFVFPSAMVASNHYFGGRTSLNAETYMNDGYNDSYVWTEDDEGVDINSGVVFISGSARVDPATGSKYLLDNDLKPIINTENAELLRKIVLDDEVFELTKQVDIRTENDELREQLSLLVEEKYGSIEVFTSFINNREGWRGPGGLNFLGSLERGLMDEASQSVFTKRGGINQILEMLPPMDKFKRPNETVSSQEFWENYFAQHPKQKPNKVQYYFGDGPRDALFWWKKRNGLTKKSETSDFGFPERVGMPNSEESRIKFIAVANEAVDYVFPEEIQAA